MSETPHYTPELLREFDELTERLSSLRQMDRISARLEMPNFIAKHGRSVCDAMFEELKRRDASESHIGSEKK